ncbi:MAG: hypothetical protein LBN30_00855 [Oscillospiraceae bacterium]|jgi:prolyl-tRNA synthetase|nr:hypothetical protein [Oscillospiraceae bacterium]
MKQMKLTTPLPPEVLERIRNGRKAVEGEEANIIRCPKCRHVLMKKYSDAKGHIDCKCTKCGEEFVVDLFSWRRAR